MTKGITEKEPDPRIVYAEYINLPHHVSPTRPQMSLYDRAAQFSPFAALTGYDDMIAEEARWVGKKTELGDDDSELLSLKLNKIAELIEKGQRPCVSITYFQPDKKKAGGKYVTTTEEIYRVDQVERRLILARMEGVGQLRAAIALDRIQDIRGDIINESDEGMYNSL